MSEEVLISAIIAAAVQLQDTLEHNRCCAVFGVRRESELARQALCKAYKQWQTAIELIK